MEILVHFVSAIFKGFALLLVGFGVLDVLEAYAESIRYNSKPKRRKPVTRKKTATV